MGAYMVTQLKLDSLLPFIEVFAKVGGQQAADPVIRKEHLKVPQQLALGLIWLVLCLQHFIRDHLDRTHGKTTCRL